MTTSAILLASRAGAFGMKYSKTALRFLKQNWAGITGNAVVTGTAVGGSIWIEDRLSDDELKSEIQGMHAEELSDDEKDYAVQVVKDTADDIKAGEIFVPYSERLNSYINPTHCVIHLQTGRSWMTNNYISPNYVKAIKMNTVNVRSTFKKKRY